MSAPRYAALPQHDEHDEGDSDGDQPELPFADPDVPMLVAPRDHDDEGGAEEQAFEPAGHLQAEEIEPSNYEPFLPVKERFVAAKKLRDQPFLAAFLTHLLVALVIGIKEGVQVIACHCVTRAALSWVYLVCGLSIVGIASGAAILLALHHCMRVFVLAVLMASCCIPLFVAAVALSSGNWLGVVPSLLSSALGFLFLSLFRARIEFATALLSVVVSCVRKNPSVVALALAAAIPQAVWTLFIVMTLYGTALTRDSEPMLVYWLQIVFLLLSGFWTFQVIRNTVHVTTAGVVSTWFFYRDSDSPPDPTQRALRRACTVSAGSVCFGSLLIAIVQTARFLVHYARRQKKSETLARVAEVTAAMLEGVLVYFNKYALVYVAVYGTSFMQSARNMGRMISSRGFSAVLNDDITSIVLTFVCVLNALVVACIVMVLGAMSNHSLSTTTLTTSLWVGYCVASVVTSVVSSGVSTVYVCFMEESSALRSTHVEAYNALASAWMIMYGGEFAASSRPPSSARGDQQL